MSTIRICLISFYHLRGGGGGLVIAYNENPSDSLKLNLYEMKTGSSRWLTTKLNQKVL